MQEDTAKYYAHDSYGMIGFNRNPSSTPHNLFGSNVDHGNTVTLTIKRGEVERHLSREWYRGRNELIEIELSADQFATLLTTMNVGAGVPCTIIHVDGKRPGPPPRQDTEIANMSREFKHKVKSISTDLDLIVAKLHEKGGLSASEKKELAEAAYRARQNIKDNMPFLMEAFEKNIGKIITQAKSAIDNFWTASMFKLGIKTSRDQRALIVDADEALRIADGEDEK